MFSKNTIWNLSGNAIPLLVGVTAIPLLIKEVGTERFGVLTLLWVIIGYASLFDLGVGRALTQQIASRMGNKRESEISEVIASGIILTLVFGLLGLTILALTSEFIANKVINPTGIKTPEVTHSLWIVALGIPLTTLSSGYRGILEGMENFNLSNGARIFLGVSIFLFPLIATHFYGKSLIGIAASLVIARLMGLFFFYYLSKPIIKSFGKGRPTKHRQIDLLRFGAWMTVTNIISPLLVNADRFFISSILGASVVAFYTVPFEFLTKLLIIPAAIGGVMMPAIARRGKKGDTKKEYNRSIALIAAIMLTSVLITYFFADTILAYFVDVDFSKKSYVIANILAVGVLLNSLAYMPYTVLQARGHVKTTGLLHTIELAFYIPILYFMIIKFGVTGAAIAWVMRVAIDTVALFYLERKLT